MSQRTAMQKLWEWIDTNCHEESFNINDAKDMSLKLEKDQLIDAHKHGFTEGAVFGAASISYKPVTSEQYYNETYNK
jgi:hypothetical protein